MFNCVQIKKEPLNENVSKKKKSKKNSELQLGLLKCTCKKLCPDQAEPFAPDRKLKRQILVNFGLTRKKVFTLFSEDDKLHKIFKSYILSEPAFSKLLLDSYVLFQEFSDKFGTWVDIDKDAFIEDGTVLKAVFFPISIERDESNPGSIKRKETGQAESGKACRDIVIDISSSEEDGNDNETNSSKMQQSDLASEDDEIVKKSRSKKKKKRKNVPDIEQSSNGEMSKKKGSGKLKNATVGQTTKVSGAESNQNQPSSFNSTPQQTPKKGNRAAAPTHFAQQDPFLPHDHSSHSTPKYNNYKPYNHQNSEGNINYQNNGTYWCKKTYRISETYQNRQYTGENCATDASEANVLEPVEKICQERNWPPPEITTESHLHGWTCKVWVKGMCYMTRNADVEKAKKRAVQKVVKELTNPNNNYFPKYM